MCWHRAERSFYNGKQGGTAENVISVLVPIGEQGLFLLGRSGCICIIPGDDGGTEEFTKNLHLSVIY